MKRATGWSDIFLTTEFGGGRHARRVAKIAAIGAYEPKEQLEKHE